VERVVGAGAGLDVDDLAQSRGMLRVDAHDEAFVVAFERDGAVDEGVRAELLDQVDVDDRPVPAAWPRPTHVGNHKYLADFWIIEASDLGVALKLAAEGSKACNRKVEVRRNAAKAAGCASAGAGVQ
jgi:hypothetical protein